MTEEGATEQVMVGGAEAETTTDTGEEVLAAREEEPAKTAVIECVPWLSVETDSCA